MIVITVRKHLFLSPYVGLCATFHQMHRIQLSKLHIWMTPPHSKTVLKSLSPVWSPSVSISSIAQWLIAEVPEGGHIGFDPFLFSLRESLQLPSCPTPHSPRYHQEGARSSVCKTYVFISISTALRRLIRRDWFTLLWVIVCNFLL